MSCIFSGYLLKPFKLAYFSALNTADPLTGCSYNNLNDNLLIFFLDAGFVEILRKLRLYT